MAHAHFVFTPNNLGGRAGGVKAAPPRRLGGCPRWGDPMVFEASHARSTEEPPPCPPRCAARSVLPWRFSPPSRPSSLPRRQRPRPCSTRSMPASWAGRSRATPPTGNRRPGAARRLPRRPRPRNRSQNCAFAPVPWLRDRGALDAGATLSANVLQELLAEHRRPAQAHVRDRGSGRSRRGDLQSHPAFETWTRSAVSPSPADVPEARLQVEFRGSAETMGFDRFTHAVPGCHDAASRPVVHVSDVTACEHLSMAGTACPAVDPSTDRRFRRRRPSCWRRWRRWGAPRCGRQSRRIRCTASRLPPERPSAWPMASRTSTSLRPTSIPPPGCCGSPMSTPARSAACAWRAP